MAKRRQKRKTSTPSAARRRAAQPTSAQELPESTHSAQFYGDGTTPRTVEPEPTAGRYPRGYGRLADRIGEEVKDRLTAYSRLDASSIEVRFAEDEVVLHGRVSDPGAKKLAEDVAKRVAGVRTVRNELRIEASEGGGERRTG